MITATLKYRSQFTDDDPTIIVIGELNTFSFGLIDFEICRGGDRRDFYLLITFPFFIKKKETCELLMSELSDHLYSVNVCLEYEINPLVHKIF
jgi:hypothetical protein